MSIVTLDLHGIRHHEVELIVENFVYKEQFNFPILIICGNSNAMINEVNKVLKKIKCEYKESRYGLIRVESFI